MGDSMENNSVAVIVAAGTGKRMGGTVKKQYLEIHGFPVLYFTLKAFEESNINRMRPRPKNRTNLPPKNRMRQRPKSRTKQRP